MTHPILSTYRNNSLGSQRAANTLARILRTDGSILGHPSDGENKTKFLKCTQADTQVNWGQYVIINGFYPNMAAKGGKEATLYELQYISNQLDLRFDSEYIDEMYASNGWAIRRYSDCLGTTSGFLLRLKTKHLFGTFGINSSTHGRITPLTASVKGSPKFPLRTYFLMGVPDPVDLKGILLDEDSYPTLFTVRALPYDKDRNTLMSAAIHTLRAFLDVYCEGLYVLSSILVHHDVAVESARINGRYEEVYKYRDGSTTSSKGSIRYVREPIIAVIYTGPPPGATGSISPSFYEELKAQLLQKVRESVTNSPPTT